MSTNPFRGGGGGGGDEDDAVEDEESTSTSEATDSANSGGPRSGPDIQPEDGDRTDSADSSASGGDFQDTIGFADSPGVSDDSGGPRSQQDLRPSDEPSGGGSSDADPQGPDGQTGGPESDPDIQPSTGTESGSSGSADDTTSADGDQSSGSSTGSESQPDTDPIPGPGPGVDRSGAEVERAIPQKDEPGRDAQQPDLPGDPVADERQDEVIGSLAEQTQFTEDQIRTARRTDEGFVPVLTEETRRQRALDQFREQADSGELFDGFATNENAVEDVRQTDSGGFVPVIDEGVQQFAASQQFREQAAENELFSGFDADPQDITGADRTDDGQFVPNLSEGAQQQRAVRAFREQARNDELEIAGEDVGAVAVEDARRTEDGGFAPVINDAVVQDIVQERQDRQAAFDVQNQVRSQRFGGVSDAAARSQSAIDVDPGDDVTAAVTEAGTSVQLARDFEEELIEEQIQQQTETRLQAGEDFVVDVRDRGSEALAGEQTRDRTVEFEDEAIEREVFSQVRPELEDEFGVDNLDREDVRVTRDDGEFQATLSDEGERTVAVETAPFQDAPVLSTVSRTGAGLRQDFEQTTEPARERFDSVTPDQGDVGAFVTENVPGADRVAAAGETAEDELDAFRDTAQEEIDERVPDLDDVSDLLPGRNEALAGTAALGVTGTAGVGASGTGAAIGTGLAGLSAGPVLAGAGLTAAAGTVAAGGAGFTSGDVREESVSADAPATEIGIGSGVTDQELDVDDETDTTELDISQGTGQTEITQPESVSPSATNVAVPTGDIFNSELDPAQESGGGGTAGAPQDETVVPDDFPLPGRDLPADPSREFISGESEQAVADATPIQQSRQGQRREDNLEEISGDDILGERQQPDQPGPSVREQIRRDDLFAPQREFPTGEGAVVGRDTGQTSERTQDRLRDAQRPFTEEGSTVTGVSETTGISFAETGDPFLTGAAGRLDDAQSSTVLTGQSPRDRLDTDARVGVGSQQDGRLNIDVATDIQPVSAQQQELTIATGQQQQFSQQTATPTSNANAPGFGQDFASTSPSFGQPGVPSTPNTASERAIFGEDPDSGDDDDLRESSILGEEFENPVRSVESLFDGGVFNDSNGGGLFD